MLQRLPGKIVCFYCFLFGNAAFAQTALSDSNMLNASIQQVIRFHNEVLGENIHLYNGPENTGYNHLSVGHPYFMADSVQTGTLFYDGILYHNVPMLYDLEKDNAVILQHADKSFSQEYRNILRMDLIRSRVLWFSLPDHDFVRLEADSNRKNMADGFYDRAYNGKIKVFIKREKRYVEEVKQTDLERRYDAFTYYYIQKAGVYYSIKSKKAVLDVFKNRRKELKVFIRKNGLKFRKNQGPFITEVSSYYDQLTN